MTMSSQPESNTELNELRTRLARLERMHVQRARRWRRVLAVASVAAVSVAGVAIAADGDCATGLVCFQPSTPAHASQVNQNFAQLKQWIEQKVGAAGSSDVTIQGTTTTKNLSVDGALQVSGAISGGSLAAPSAVITNLTTGSLTIAGDIVASSNTSTLVNPNHTMIGAGIAVGDDTDATKIYPASTNTWHDVYCPNGTFVCGFGTYDRNGSNWWDLLFHIQCCTL